MVTRLVGTVARFGLTPLKGAGHTSPAALDLSDEGPSHDRRWCLVERADDPERARVLRTVENPALLALRAEVDDDGQLLVALPEGTTLRPDTEPGSVVTADYWGRRARLRLTPGPWDRTLSRYTGRSVTLAVVAAPGEVVWDAPVTIVTTSALAELARRAGRDAIDPERFRGTLCLDTGPDPGFPEDEWIGRRLHVGSVELEIGGLVPRCGVVRLRPGNGAREADDPLRLLARDRVVDGEIVFGVGARVVTPGTARLGDPATLV